MQRGNLKIVSLGGQLRPSMMEEIQGMLSVNNISMPFLFLCKIVAFLVRPGTHYAILACDVPIFVLYHSLVLR